jgi:hypothetical protein
VKGSCRCGAVRFETRAKPTATSFRHCSQCRGYDDLPKGVPAYPEAGPD